jgi:hypothetical protein
VSAKGKFCVLIKASRWGPRDEFLGLKTVGVECFRKMRQARAYVRSVNKTDPWNDVMDGGVEAVFWKKRGRRALSKTVKISPRQRKRLQAAAKRARDLIPF